MYAVILPYLTPALVAGAGIEFFLCCKQVGNGGVGRISKTVFCSLHPVFPVIRHDNRAVIAVGCAHIQLILKHGHGLPLKPSGGMGIAKTVIIYLTERKKPTDPTLSAEELNRLLL